MEQDTLLMTPGPVQLSSDVMLAGAQPLAHHRTSDFSPVYTEVTNLCKKFFETKGRLFLTTSSGTGAMEAAIVNLFEPDETIISVETGVFGERFTDIAHARGLNVLKVTSEPGSRVKLNLISEILLKKPSVKGVTVTFNETSTGVKNDIEAIGKLLKDKDIMLVVDGVSGIGALPFKMDEWHVDVAVSASQKGFLAPPGIGMIAVSDRAWAKIQQVKCSSVYFNLKRYESSLEKDIPANPWTPAISVLYSLLTALRKIDKTGIEKYHNHYKLLAGGVRAALAALNLSLFTDEKSCSDVLTVFHAPEGIPPKKIVSEIRDQFNILIAGGHGIYADRIMRITTIGAISQRDVIATIGALDMVLSKHGWTKSSGRGTKALIDYFLKYQ